MNFQNTAIKETEQHNEWPLMNNYQWPAALKRSWRVEISSWLVVEVEALEQNFISSSWMFFIVNPSMFNKNYFIPSYRPAVDLNVNSVMLNKKTLDIHLMLTSSVSSWTTSKKDVDICNRHKTICSFHVRYLDHLNQKDLRAGDFVTSDRSNLPLSSVYWKGRSHAFKAWELTNICIIGKSKLRLEGFFSF